MEVCKRNPSASGPGTFGGAIRLNEAQPHEHFLLNESNHQLAHPKSTPGPGAYTTPGMFEQLVATASNSQVQVPFTTTERRFHIQSMNRARSRAIPGPGQYGNVNIKAAHTSQHPVAPRAAFPNETRMKDPNPRSPGPKYLPPVHVENHHINSPRVGVPRALRTNDVLGLVGEPSVPRTSTPTFMFNSPTSPGSSDEFGPRSPASRGGTRVLSPIRSLRPGPADYTYTVKAVEQTRGIRAPSWGFGTASLGRGMPPKSREASPEKALPGSPPRRGSPEKTMRTPGAGDYVYPIKAVEQTRGTRAPAWGFGTAALGRDPLPRPGTSPSPSRSRQGSPERRRNTSPNTHLRPHPPAQPPAVSPRSTFNRSPLKARLPKNQQQAAHASASGSADGSDTKPGTPSNAWTADPASYGSDGGPGEAADNGSILGESVGGHGLEQGMPGSQEILPSKPVEEADTGSASADKEDATEENSGGAEEDADTQDAAADGDAGDPGLGDGDDHDAGDTDAAADGAVDEGTGDAAGDAEDDGAGDAAADTGTGDAAEDTGTGDAAEDTGTGDAAADTGTGDAAADTGTGDAAADTGAGDASVVDDGAAGSFTAAGDEATAGTVFAATDAEGDSVAAETEGAGSDSHDAAADAGLQAATEKGAA